ncbi:protein PET117 homolog, mitochondrial [Denticeps clupeoides]|uniref:protein PET117 homolog, mitochondrial n=1 Tax=Denticeps clupeoides TaxID=299321 RepID=UPI0010A40D5A|nr:protein PET117 homolog, mitochondrial [Denticeps clupeoides]
MSRASKAALGVSVLLTACIVTGVHLRQARDRQRLRQGVVRDLERQERKREKLRSLEEQIALTRELEAERRAAAAAAAEHRS